MRTIIHPTEAAELRLLLRRLLVAMLHEVSPGPQLTAHFNCRNLLNKNLAVTTSCAL